MLARSVLTRTSARSFQATLHGFKKRRGLEGGANPSPPNTPAHLAIPVVTNLRHAPLTGQIQFIIYLKHALSFDGLGSSHLQMVKPTQTQSKPQTHPNPRQTHYTRSNPQIQPKPTLNPSSLIHFIVLSFLTILSFFLYFVFLFLCRVDQRCFLSSFQNFLRFAKMLF